MSPSFAASAVKRATGIETVFHLTPRDMNRSAIAGVLLSAGESGLSNVLAITGDHYTPNEQQVISKNVYDVEGTEELIRFIKSVESQTSMSFCVLVGADPTVVYGNTREKIDREIDRLLARQEAGAEMVQTQPIFDARFLDFVDAAKDRGLTIPILAGLIPLKDEHDCIEIARRFGILIPGEVKSSVTRKGEDAGISMLRDLYRDLVKQGVAGVHIYPRERPDYVAQIVMPAS
jgi:methylenetetrahydrofolate reductase (NADPH)